MASDFFSILEANGFDNKKNLIFIEENHGTNASFILTSFMWQTTIENAEVILLTCHNPIHHYLHLSNKLTNKLYQKPKFNHLNLLDFFEDDEDILNVENLLKTISELCQQINGKNMYLIIDDISYILLLSSLYQCIHFLRCCMKLLINFSNLKIIICNHISTEDEECTIISKFLQHLSKFIISIIPLKSGFSTEITGRINIITKQKYKNILNKYNYKLENNKFLFYPYVI